MAAPGPGAQNLEPGFRLVLEELRDLRLEMRDDRRRADEDRRRADEERRQADAETQRERARSDERFDQLMRDFREDSARREAATQRAFREIRAVGSSIVKTLNHHTRILERIERKLGGRDNGSPGQGNGRGRSRS